MRPHRCASNRNRACGHVGRRIDRGVGERELGQRGAGTQGTRSSFSQLGQLGLIVATAAPRKHAQACEAGKGQNCLFEHICLQVGSNLQP